MEQNVSLWVSLLFLGLDSQRERLLPCPHQTPEIWEQWWWPLEPFSFTVGFFCPFSKGSFE